MGTLSVQPPTGMMRNITEVFILLRNNSFQSKFININETTGTTGLLFISLLIVFFKIFKF